jgi:predicted metal-binding protein
VSEACRPRLIVCTTCRAGRALADGEAPPGARLHAALAGLIAATAAAVELREVACMANCERGCSAALAMPRKWIFFLGHLTPDHAADLLSYAAAYAAHATGTVMPSRRPASLRDVVLGRLPHLEFAA